MMTCISVNYCSTAMIRYYKQLCHDMLLHNSLADQFTNIEDNIYHNNDNKVNCDDLEVYILQTAVLTESRY